MIKNPMISFCMSTYKRPDLLKKQLNSLLQQDYPHFEIIVSDNDIEASAQTVVKNINDTRIKYFNNGVDLGMVKSFNKSLERSSGDYVVMIADDDPATTDMLSTLVAIQNQYPGYGVYAGTAGVLIENEFSAKALEMSQGLHPKLLPNVQENSLIFLKDNEFIERYLGGFFGNAFLLWSSCMVERNIAISVGGMPDYKSEFLTDHAYMLTTCSKKGMAFINRVLGSQTLRDDNFGFAFEKLKEKYIHSPQYIHDYFETHFHELAEWKTLDRMIWNFLGREWVEYSLMQYRRFKKTGASTKSFFEAFNKAFSNKHIRKWRFKFYLKAYCSPLFTVLLNLKNTIMPNAGNKPENYARTSL